MYIFRSTLLLLLGVLLAPALSAQIVKDPTTWTVELKKIEGNKYKATVHLKLAEGWHIWALEPGGDGLQVPPQITFDRNPAIKPQGKLKETGKKITGPMEGVDGIVNYYERQVDYEQVLLITGNTKLTGKYYYQVCDEKMCLAPKTKKFSVAVTDAGPAADSVAGNSPDTAVLAAAPVIPAATGGNGPDAGNTPNNPTENLKASGTEVKETVNPATQDTLLFFEGFGYGLASVITPCVFAMLPMTVSFFLKRSKDRKTGIKIALQYSLSIIFIFSAIGGLIAFFFKPDALHTFSTNWIVNLFFAAVFIAFGLSFLGAFDINLPSSWATKLDSRANTRNFMGIFFMALTLVIVSFSCTGPFISGMITLMGKGSKVGPLIGFFGFGMGLALPFSLFAIFPSVMNELGKQGGWLNVVKVTFGFVELALALKFLSNADLQRGWRLLDREIFIAIWAGLAFMLALYLLGVFRFSHDSDMPKNDWGLPYLSVTRFIFAAAAIFFTVYLMPGMWGAPLNGMGAFVPPMGTFDEFPGGGGIGQTEGVLVSNTAEADGGALRPVKFVSQMKLQEPPVVRQHRMTVYFDYEEALAAGRKLNKPVMLDFTGINCVNCRKMETSVWSNREVMERLKNDFVLASLYCDADGVPLPKEDQFYSKSLEGQVETLGEKNQDLQIRIFESNSLPSYFFVDGEGNRLADKGVFYPTSAAEFITHLDKVKARYAEQQQKQAAGNNQASL